MSANQNRKPAVKKRSSRERKIRFVIYLMIIAMLLTSITTGLAMFI